MLRPISTWWSPVAPVSLPANGSVAPVTVSVRAVRYARRMLVSGDFDVVHVHEPFTPGVPYGLLLGRGIPPVVATFHRSGPSVFYRMLRPLTRRLSGRFAVQCAVSEAASATASRALGGTVDIVFNGVEVDRYQDVEPWPSDRPTVLFLGRHEERKGLHGLLEAAADLDQVTGAGHRRRAGRPRLWIAGDGPQTNALRQHHPDSADIEWLGVLSEEEKIRRLVAADVLCAPSLGGESFGMVLLEGMAARTVVVASDIDGYRAAAGRLAVLVPPGDAQALSVALNGVLSGRSAVSTPGGEDDRAGGAPGRRRAEPMAGFGGRAGLGVLHEPAGRPLRGLLPLVHGRPTGLSGRTLLERCLTSLPSPNPGPSQAGEAVDPAVVARRRDGHRPDPVDRESGAETGTGTVTATGEAGAGPRAVEAAAAGRRRGIRAEAAAARRPEPGPPAETRVRRPGIGARAGPERPDPERPDPPPGHRRSRRRRPRRSSAATEEMRRRPCGPTG